MPLFFKKKNVFFLALSYQHKNSSHHFKKRNAWERLAKRFWRPRQTRSWKQVSSWIFYTKFMLPNCKCSCKFFWGWTFLSHTYPIGENKTGQAFVCFFLVVFVRSSGGFKLDMNQSHGSSLSLSCAAVVARRLWMTSPTVDGFGNPAITWDTYLIYRKMWFFCRKKLNQSLQIME